MNKTHFKRTFLEAEKERHQYLLKKANFNRLVNNLRANFSVDQLYDLAYQHVLEIERGKVTSRDVGRYEDVILACLTATETVKKSVERDIDFDEIKPKTPVETKKNVQEKELCR